MIYNTTEYKDLTIWTLQCLDCYCFDDGECLENEDIEEILDQLNPTSEFELVSDLLMNMSEFSDEELNNLDEIRDFVFDELIDGVLTSFEKGDVNVFDKKCDLLDFILDSKN